MRVSDEELKKLEEAVKFPFKDTLLPGTWNMKMDWPNIASQLVADLRDLREKARAVTKDAKDLIEAVKDFRLDGGLGDMPFNTCDYYRMEDVLKVIDALRAEVEQTTQAE